VNFGLGGAMNVFESINLGFFIYCCGISVPVLYCYPRYYFLCEANSPSYPLRKFSKYG
jgi:hypothetical protein